MPTFLKANTAKGYRFLAFVCVSMCVCVSTEAVFAKKKNI